MFRFGIGLDIQKEKNENDIYSLASGCKSHKISEQNLIYYVIGTQNPSAVIELLRLYPQVYNDNDNVWAGSREIRKIVDRICEEDSQTAYGKHIIARRQLAIEQPKYQKLVDSELEILRIVYEDSNLNLKVDFPPSIGQAIRIKNHSFKGSLAKCEDVINDYKNNGGQYSNKFIRETLKELHQNREALDKYESLLECTQSEQLLAQARDAYLESNSLEDNVQAYLIDEELGYDYTFLFSSNLRKLAFKTFFTPTPKTLYLNELVKKGGVSNFAQIFENYGVSQEGQNSIKLGAELASFDAVDSME